MTLMAEKDGQTLRDLFAERIQQVLSAVRSAPEAGEGEQADETLPDL